MPNAERHLGFIVCQRTFMHCALMWPSAWGWRFILAYPSFQRARWEKFSCCRNDDCDLAR